MAEEQEFKAGQRWILTERSKNIVVEIICAAERWVINCGGLVRGGEQLGDMLVLGEETQELDVYHKKCFYALYTKEALTSCNRERSHNRALEKLTGEERKLLGLAEPTGIL